MATYFSKFERNNFLAIICAFDCARDLADDKKSCLSDYERNKLINAVDEMQSVVKSMADRLETKYLKKILSDAANYEVAIIPKRTCETEEKTIVNSENLEVIAEFALWKNCQASEGCKTEDFKKCNLYNALIDCGIPVADLHTTGCPYRL